MSSEPIPYFENMPKDISVASLSCARICDSASRELGRNPTAQETRELFEKVQEELFEKMDESLTYELDIIVKEHVERMLISKPYNPAQMTIRELLSKKYCHECGNVQETHWEHIYDGIHNAGIYNAGIYNTGIGSTRIWNPKEHVCIPRNHISPEYFKKHKIREICDNCQHQIQSAALVEKQPHITETFINNGTKNVQELYLDEQMIKVNVKSLVGQTLTEQTKADIVELFLNSNLQDWKLDGKEIHDTYTLVVDEKIDRSKDDDDYIIISISSNGDYCECMYMYGFRQIQ